MDPMTSKRKKRRLTMTSLLPKMPTNPTAPASRRTGRYRRVAVQAGERIQEEGGKSGNRTWRGTASLRTNAGKKRKNWMDKLGHRYQGLAARNGFLAEEVNSLGNIVLDLKELVFQHVECGYAPIEGYIKVEAHKTQAWARSRGQQLLSMEESPLQSQLQGGMPPTFDIPKTDLGGTRHEDSAMAAGSAST